VVRLLAVAAALEEKQERLAPGCLAREHPVGGPNGVASQSTAARSRPTSPPVAKTSSTPVARDASSRTLCMRSPSSRFDGDPPQTDATARHSTPLAGQESIGRLGEGCPDGQR
jgi:hypothetical protein